MAKCNGFIVDACVMMDTFLPFRKRHQQAVELLMLLKEYDVKLFIPSHAYFEYATAAITHFKHEPEILQAAPVSPHLLPQCDIEIVALSNEYVLELLNDLQGKPIPDLKSQDMIYFCIARHQSLILITEDKKLRNVSRKGGITVLTILEAIEFLASQTPKSH